MGRIRIFCLPGRHGVTGSRASRGDGITGVTGSRGLGRHEVSGVMGSRASPRGKDHFGALHGQAVDEQGTDVDTGHSIAVIVLHLVDPFL